MCIFGLFCINLVGWIETLGELSQIVRAQILVCDSGDPGGGAPEAQRFQTFEYSLMGLF